MSTRNLLVAASLVVFLLVLSLFFVNIPWRNEIHEVPVFNGTGSDGVANDLFTSYPITLILIALLLSSAMIGGVYLAKMEEKP